MNPVKTDVMNVIYASLNNVSEIKQIKRGQGIPINQDIAIYPWACFFSEQETKKMNNRLMMKTFDLVIQVWVKQTSTLSIDEQCQIIDAEIEKTLMNATVNTALLKLNPKTSEIFYIDDNETAILQTVYEVTYSHKYNDPYDPSRGI